MFTVARAYSLPLHDLALWTQPGSLARKVNTHKCMHTHRHRIL